MENQASQPPSPSPSSPKQDDVSIEQSTPDSTAILESQEACSQGLSLSQLSQPENSPLDLERHPKGKRKRTAAKDKAVLEAAYHANPKPDKAARLDIVKRVSLNEKEVQIWFQNRRQNDRRKSRPLSPQEIAALRYGGMQILSSDPAIYNTASNPNSNDCSPNQSQLFAEARANSPARSEHGIFNFEKDEGSMGQNEDNTRREGSETSHKESAPQTAQRPAAAADASFQMSRSFPGSVGYLANRWNTGSNFSTPSTLGHRAGDESLRLEPFGLSTSAPTTSSGAVLPAPSSQSSQFRLSLSLEGKAEVIESTTPPHLPPPRPSAEALAALPPVSRPNLTRSHSAQASVTLPPISTLTGSLPNTSAGALPPRLTRGRSRDVHAWEFCCEADSQEDPLIAQAQYESSGSAIAQISLIRSTSATGSTAATTSPLQPSSSAKRNAQMSKAAPRMGGAKKPRLARWSTTSARPQSSTLLDEKENAQAGQGASDMCKDRPFKRSLASPSGNDSDKENWSPDGEGNPHYRFTSTMPDSTPSGGRRPPPPAQCSSSIHSSKYSSVNPRRAAGHGRSSIMFQESSPLRPSVFGHGRSNTAPVGRHYKAGSKTMTPTRLEIFEDSPRSSSGRGAPNARSPRPEDDDDEVERFMRGAVTPAKKCDVDAVAGLLSLSQGKWR